MAATFKIGGNRSDAEGRGHGEGDRDGISEKESKRNIAEGND
jgi:hypothetical protein